jgi:hypothetical protein
MGIQWMVHWWVLVASGCEGSQNYLVSYLTLKAGERLGDLMGTRQNQPAEV